ncbi:MAG: glucokinase [Candidatus Binataceae bacterium]
MTAVILAGDVGGTKTHLGLYRVDGNELAPLRDQLYVTRDYPSLQAVVADFLKGASAIKAACFGVPGPVVDGVSQATNVTWDMREAEIAAAIKGTPATRLINDLQATAYGVLRLDDSQFAVLQRGEKRGVGENMAVVAAGTGLGEAALIAMPGGGYHAIASEGGHCDFAPRGREQERLLEFLGREFDHVSFERVLSGPGLHNIYRFLLAQQPDGEPEWLTQRMLSEDPSALISAAALQGRDPRCVHALEIFVAIYGAEAANVMLKVLALGGVYLGGGIAPKILPFLERGGFVSAFVNKGRFKDLLQKIEIRVSLNEAAALLGAAHIAASIL